MATPPAAPPSLWFITGSQNLYGPAVLKQVAANSTALVNALNATKTIPTPIVFKPIVTTPEAVRQVCEDADHDPTCAGLILWMHTFSPAKMWVNGLAHLAKPFLHLHTQFNRDLPWSDIDMDFMNLNQAAHGDREAGALHTRLRIPRKVVVGHWSDPAVHQQIANWSRAAWARHDLQGAKFARFGDSMRFVAVTDGDKVSAEIKFGFSVNTFGIGDLVEHVDAIPDAAITELCSQYESQYTVAPALRKGADRHQALRDGARIELGLRSFLTHGNFKGFTTSFEVLHGLKQLPGLAVQRLMADGYGFAAEGDWKTAALLRAMKVMATGLPNGTSFMEDYTYHLDPQNKLVLGAHMLEICPTIAATKPTLEIHPLGIGGKEDPVRLVFDSKAGPAVNASLIDLGNRFRLLIHEVDAVTVPQPLPKLPVARAVWRARPTFEIGAAAWIYAGGAHHTGFSFDLTTEHLENFATFFNLETAIIDAHTTIRDFQQTLRNNELYYHLAPGLGRM